MVGFKTQLNANFPTLFPHFSTNVSATAVWPCIGQLGAPRWMALTRPLHRRPALALVLFLLLALLVEAVMVVEVLRWLVASLDHVS